MRRSSVALVVALAAAGAGCGDEAGPSRTSNTPPSPSAESSVPATLAVVVPPSSTSTPSASVEPSTSSAPAPGSTLQRWIDEQIVEGRTRGFEVTGPGTQARLVVAYRGAVEDVAAIVQLADGSIVELPADLPRGPTAPFVAGVGGRPVLIGRVDDHLELWALDPSTLVWAEPLPLGVLAGDQAVPEVLDLDGRLLVANETVREDSTNPGSYVPDRQEGVIVAPDLTLTVMVAPPAGLYMDFTATVGRRAFVLGRDIGGGGVAPLTEPWEFDASTNAWSALPQPAWLGCAPNCTWTAPHEYGDVILEAALADSFVMKLPDGTIGRYTPDDSTWRQMDPAPFRLTSPAVASVGRSVVVAPQPVIGLDDAAVGFVGVLDAATGHWTTTALTDLGVASPSDHRRELRTDGRVIMLGLSGDGLPPAEPTSTYDPTTATWRPPSIADRAVWTTLWTLGDSSLQSLAR